MAGERDQLRPVRREPLLSAGQRWLLTVVLISIVYGTTYGFLWWALPWTDAPWDVVSAVGITGIVAYFTGRWHEHRAERVR